MGWAQIEHVLALCRDKGPFWIEAEIGPSSVNRYVMSLTDIFYGCATVANHPS